MSSVIRYIELWNSLTHFATEDGTPQAAKRYLKPTNKLKLKWYYIWGRNYYYICEKLANITSANDFFPVVFSLISNSCVIYIILWFRENAHRLMSFHQPFLRRIIIGQSRDGILWMENHIHSHNTQKSTFTLWKRKEDSTWYTHRLFCL